MNTEEKIPSYQNNTISYGTKRYAVKEELEETSVFVDPNSCKSNG